MQSGSEPSLFGEDFFRAICLLWNPCIKRVSSHAQLFTPPTPHFYPGSTLFLLAPKLYQDPLDHPPLLNSRRPAHPSQKWVWSPSVPIAQTKHHLGGFGFVSKCYKVGKKDGSIYPHFKKCGKIRTMLMFDSAVKSSSGEVLKHRVLVFSEMV